MFIRTKDKIVLLGMMSRMPVAGVAWQTMHYLVGLQRLGYDVYYVEDHAVSPSMFMETAEDDGSERAAAYIDSICRRIDLADKWAFHALHADGRCFGLSHLQLKQLYQEAALIINLHGGTNPRPEHYATNRLVFLETDPVELQIQLHENNQQAIDYLSPHCAFFTFGENYGRPDCLLPVTNRFDFKPTRQPIVCDFWNSLNIPPGNKFTTIGNWHQPDRVVTFRGETYHWSKHYEFLKFLDLPTRAASSASFELALGKCDAAARQMLESNGWHVCSALDFSREPDPYRRYITASRGEFTVAKDQNVRLKSGWFSDRSATYLAAGRPVITQDTGFGNSLPTGRGLFAFQTMDEILTAVDVINADYEAQCRAAAELAREHFDAQRVLSELLGTVGVEKSARDGRTLSGATSRG